MSPFSGPLVLRTRNGDVVATALPEEEDEASQPMVLRADGNKMWAPFSLVARLAREVAGITVPNEPLVLRYEGSGIEADGPRIARMLDAASQLYSTFGPAELPASREPKGPASPEPQAAPYRDPSTGPTDGT